LSLLSLKLCIQTQTAATNFKPRWLHKGQIQQSKTAKCSVVPGEERGTNPWPKTTTKLFALGGISITSELKVHAAVWKMESLPRQRYCA